MEKYHQTVDGRITRICMPLANHMQASDINLVVSVRGIPNRVDQQDKEKPAGARRPRLRRIPDLEISRL